VTEKNETKADCYSAGERKWMLLYQKLRQRFLAPVLMVLARCGITADALTLFALIAGLAFCPAYFYSKPLALVLLALHAAFDGLDGPLARHLGTASRKGSFTDTLSDQIVVAATTVTLIYGDVIAILPGSLYIFLYTVVIAFSMIRNALSIPYSWLIRPRLIVYLWFLVELYLVPGSIGIVLWCFNALLAVKMCSGFIKIRRRI
jgi:phosphatidylglycerophosphate synthase